MPLALHSPVFDEQDTKRSPGYALLTEPSELMTPLVTGTNKPATA